jgi:hypothetical protein
LKNRPKPQGEINTFIELVNQWREYNIDSAEVYLAKVEACIPKIDNQNAIARFYHLKGNIQSDNG